MAVLAWHTILRNRDNGVLYRSAWSNNIYAVASDFSHNRSPNRARHSQLVLRRVRLVFADDEDCLCAFGTSERYARAKLHLGVFGLLYHHTVFEQMIDSSQLPTNRAELKLGVSVGAVLG